MEFKITRKSVEVVQADGTIKRYTNYFLVTDTGSYVAIKPAFNNDYKTLYVLSTDVTIK
jgi:hypothetical protein